jgi:hypothetical protein
MHQQAVGGGGFAWSLNSAGTTSFWRQLYNRLQTMCELKNIDNFARWMWITWKMAQKIQSLDPQLLVTVKTASGIFKYILDTLIREYIHWRIPHLCFLRHNLFHHFLLRFPLPEPVLSDLKGLSHEIFRPVFWSVWMYLGLNMNRLWF